MLYAGLGLYLTVITKKVVDSAVSGDKNGIISYAIVLCIIIAIQLTSDYLISRFTNIITYLLKKNFQKRMLMQILNKSYCEIETYHSGELVNRMFSDVSVVSEGITSIIPPLALFLTQIIGGSILLATIDLKFLILIIMVATGSVLVGLTLKKKSKHLHKNMQAKEGQVHAVLQESLQNIRLIKASESEKRIEEQTETRQSNLLIAQIKRLNFSLLASTGIRTVFRSGWLFAIIWGCINISLNKITYGTLTSVLQLVNQVQMPFASMSGLLSRFYSTLSSAERIEEILNLPDEEPKDENVGSTEELYNKLQSISFENVSFSYKVGDKVIKKGDFTLSKGDFASVTGLSGGGKTTMFLLLLGIYNPTAGNITFNFTDKSINAGRNTRCMFSYVPQGNTLFSGTLRENITMFCADATEEEINEACRIACIDDFISSLSEGLDTLIGERGLGISEGQAQRIAVARAFLSKSPILLLDEATSALDEQTEAQLLQNISLQKNRTCIIVTHRKAALSICNKYIILKNGKLSELKPSK